MPHHLVAEAAPAGFGVARPGAPIGLERRAGLARRIDGERGSVTAEFAAVVPAVLLVLALGLGAVGAVVQQARLTDAAADAARALARGDGDAAARAHVAANVGAASVSARRSGDDVCVSVGQSVAGPVGLLGASVAGRGCALADPPGTDPGGGP
jgi:Flp pilus assembly protein TadG